MKQAYNKFLQSDQNILSCLLPKAQKPRQYALAAEEKRYSVRTAMTLSTNAVKLKIKCQFEMLGNPASIPLQRRGTFTATLVEKGVEVDNLGSLPLLPWEVFDEAVQIIIENGGKAMKGNAMKARLGDPNLPLNSVEGHVARKVYQRQIGNTVFRRISPLSAILVWSGICYLEPGVLVLDKSLYARK